MSVLHLQVPKISCQALCCLIRRLVPRYQFDRQPLIYSESIDNIASDQYDREPSSVGQSTLSAYAAKVTDALKLW